MEREQDLDQGHQKETLFSLTRYADLFVQRWDTYARQKEGSRSYFRVKGPGGRPMPLTMDILVKHLRGEITIGLYSVDPVGKTKWSVLDSDRKLAPLLAARWQLAERQVPSYLEISRAGGHLWMFWREPIQPSAARKILSPYAPDLEIFPAGDIPDEDGLGLLIRAPLGLHRFTGRRYPFIGDDLKPVSLGVARGQIDWLAHNVERVDHDPLLATLLQKDPQVIRPKATTPVFDAAERKPIATFLETHDIRSVVGQYVHLNAIGVGRCPWPERHKHRDRHPSFAVFDRTGKWWCFTERIGGNAFDFLCRYHNLEAGEILRRLRG